MCVTCEEMKALEKRADECGLSYYQMMENAGTCAANVIMDRVPRGTAMVFCGKGNNGGDGFVVARLLCEEGYRVMLILVDGEPTTPDAISNYELARKLPLHLTDLSENHLLITEFADAPEIVVDAIYGTGFHGELRGNGLTAAEYMNRIRREGSRIFALDIPSGLGGNMTDDSQLDNRAVKADCTITFHAKKPVHQQDFASLYCGQIIVADIGIGKAIGKTTDKPE